MPVKDCEFHRVVMVITMAVIITAIGMVTATDGIMAVTPAAITTGLIAALAAMMVGLIAVLAAITTIGQAVTAAASNGVMTTPVTTTARAINDTAIPVAIIITAGNKKLSTPINSNFMLNAPSPKI